jgi:diacylglycerol O-acyltransferase / wax synthase
MSVQDALWLTMDRPNNLMVVDGAMVLAEEPTMAAMKDVFQHAVDSFPVFRRRAVPDGNGWAWQDDPDFELDRHLSRVSLPEPADIRALQEFLADLRTVPLPKDRPLWCGYIVAPVNLPDGTSGAALVTRFHHAIADGVRLTQVLLGLCETDERTVAAKVARGAKPKQASDGEPHDSIAQAALAAAADATSSVGQTVAGVATDAASAVVHPLRTLTNLPGHAVRAPGHAVDAVKSGVHGVEDGFELIRHPDRLLDGVEVLGVEDHRTTNDLSSVTKLALAGSEGTVWTGKPGQVKALSWTAPMPLDRIKRIGRSSGATVNDVMLAAISGALRRYLRQRDGYVDEVLWMVPVNLKPFEENLPPDLGNYFALIFLPMPLDSTDPRQRLMEMHHRMDRIKNSDEAVLTFGLQRIVSMSPAQVAFFLTNFFANKAVGVLTNVPGPPGPMTIAGVGVKQIVGFAPCSGDQPMTSTIFSYNGEVTVGFASDAGLVPDPSELADLVASEIDDMAEALLPA